jgi:DNA-binding transcriptional MerR regulator
MQDELLMSADAGRVLNLTPAAVRQLARRGTLPVARMTPRGVRLFTREAIEQLARQREDRAPKGLRVRAPDVQRFLAERVVQPSSSGE